MSSRNLRSYLLWKRELHLFFSQIFDPIRIIYLTLLLDTLMTYFIHAHKGVPDWETFRWLDVKTFRMQRRIRMSIWIQRSGAGSGGGAAFKCAFECGLSLPSVSKWYFFLIHIRTQWLVTWHYSYHHTCVIWFLTFNISYSSMDKSILLLCASSSPHSYFIYSIVFHFGTPPSPLLPESPTNLSSLPERSLMLYPNSSLHVKCLKRPTRTGTWRIQQ